MNISFALSKTPDTQSVAAGLDGESGRKNGASQGVDGFADLLNQLASVLPVLPAGLGTAESGTEERQDGELPTGNILPLLPVDPVADADADADVELALVASPLMSLVPPAAQALVVAGSSDASLAAGKPINNASGIAPQAIAAQLVAIGAEAPPSESSEPTSFVVRIAAADKPVDAKAADLFVTAPEGKAQSASPAPATNDRLSQAVAAGTAKATPVDAKAATASATTSQPAVQPTLDPASGDRKQDGDRPASDRQAPASQTSTADLAKVSPQLVSARFEDTMVAARAGTVTPRTVTTDQFAQVERVVEHLTAARQMDLSKPAAIAVAHKEFGALTVTFDQSGGKMNVEIAAENQESQRALAAAMASDRGMPRQQDMGGHSQSAQNQNNHAAADRHGGNGNSSAASGQGNAGDNGRSQQFDQRGRHDERARPGTQTPARNSGDDALYA